MYMSSKGQSMLQLSHEVVLGNFTAVSSRVQIHAYAAGAVLTALHCLTLHLREQQRTQQTIHSMAGKSVFMHYVGDDGMAHCPFGHLSARWH